MEASVVVDESTRGKTVKTHRSEIADHQAHEVGADWRRVPSERAGRQRGSSEMSERDGTENRRVVDDSRTRTIKDGEWREGQEEVGRSRSDKRNRLTARLCSLRSPVPGRKTSTLEDRVSRASTRWGGRKTGTMRRSEGLTRGMPTSHRRPCGNNSNRTGDESDDRRGVSAPAGGGGVWAHASDRHVGRQAFRPQA